MAFTFRDYQSGPAGSGTGDATVAVTINTQAGDLIVFACKWETANTAITSISDSVGNTYTFGTRVDVPALTEPHSQMFYCLSSVGTNASNVITLTFTSNTTFQQARAWTWSHTNPVVFDVEWGLGHDDTFDTTVCVSNSVSTTSAVELVTAFCGGFSGSENWTLQKVGGNDATGRGDSTLIDSFGWDYITSSPISSGTLQVTKVNNTVRYTILGMAFKETLSVRVPLRYTLRPQ